MRKKVILSLFAILAVCLLGGGLVMREAQAEIPLTVLQDARLEKAYQQDWAWNHLRTRERKRVYVAEMDLESAVASLRKELLTRGWTQHSVASTSPIYVFREKVGGYHISVQKEFQERGVMITVSEPQRPTTPFLKVVSAVQGYDSRYRTLRR